MCYVTYMARGESGRIVIEVDPDLKGELYNALTFQGLTLKAWFVREAQRHIRTHKQPYLFATESQRHGARPKDTV